MKHLQLFIAGLFLLNLNVKSQPQDEINLGLSFLREYEWDSAQVHLENAIIEAEAFGHWDQFFEGIYYLGYASLSSGNPELVLSYEPFLLSNLKCENSYIPSICILMGMAHRKNWNLEKALDYYDFVIENTPDKASDYAKVVGSAYNNKGVVYRNLGDYDQALLYYDKWLSHNLENGIELTAWQKANTYSNIAIVHKFRKNRPAAVSAYFKAINLLNEISDFKDREANLLGTIYNNLAALYITSEMPDSGLYYLKQNLNQLPPDHRIQADLYEFLGEAQLKKGDLKTARKWLNQSIELKRNIFSGRHPRIGRAYHHLGETLLAENKPDSALQFFQKSGIELSNDFEAIDPYQNPTPDQVYFKNHMILSLIGKGNAFREFFASSDEIKDLEASFQAFQLAADLGDEIKKHYQTQASKLILVESIVPAFEGGIKTAEQLFDLTEDDSYLADAYELATKSKATLLREVMEKDQARQKIQLPDSVILRENQLQRRLAELEKKLYEISDSARLEPLKQERFQIWEEIKSFEEILRENYPEYFRLQFAEDLSLQEIQANMKTHTVILDYFWGKESLVVFSITKKKIRLHKLDLNGPWEDELRQMINLVRNFQLAESEGMGKDQIKGFADLSYQLFLKIIKPVLPEGVEKMVVIPDGELGYLPFDLLLTSPFDSEKHFNYSSLPYLLKTHQVRSGFSVNSIVQAKRKTGSFGKLFAGFAPTYNEEPPKETLNRGERKISSVSPGSFSNLSNNDDEVLTIAETIDGDAFIGNSARESDFVEKADQYRILHIASHGFVNPSNPQLSGLALAPEAQDSAYNGLLQAYEISLMDLPADMVVLSACETGYGKLAPGEGVMSLARAFAYAGCPNMVMSYWKADDFTAAKVMTSFYRHLKDGKGKDEALRLAKLEYLNSSDLNHPFYWGAFVLVGDDQEVFQRNGWYFWGLGIVTLLGLAFLTFRFYRRKAV